MNYSELPEHKPITKVKLKEGYSKGRRLVDNKTLVHGGLIAIMQRISQLVNHPIGGIATFPIRESKSYTVFNKPKKNLVSKVRDDVCIDIGFNDYAEMPELVSKFLTVFGHPPTFPDSYVGVVQVSVTTTDQMFNFSERLGASFEIRPRDSGSDFFNTALTVALLEKNMIFPGHSFGTEQGIIDKNDPSSWKRAIADIGYINFLLDVYSNLVKYDANTTKKIQSVTSRFNQ